MDGWPRRALAEARRRAAGLCLLRPDRAVHAFDDADGTYVALSALPHPASVPRVPALPGGSVTAVLLARNGTRYLRVNMVRRAADVSGRPGGSYLLEPVVLREAALHEAAARWLRRLRAAAKGGARDRDYPCLCAAHLGLVQSGLALLHDADARRWRVLLNVRVVTNVTLSRDWSGGSCFEYPEYAGLHFPMDVDARLGVADVEHAELSDVAYVELSALLDAPDAERRVAQAGHPQWLATAAAPEDDDDGQRPELPSRQGDFLAIVPLARLAPIEQSLRLEGLAQSCVQHCLATEAAVQHALAHGGREPPAGVPRLAAG